MVRLTFKGAINYIFYAKFATENLAFSASDKPSCKLDYQRFSRHLALLAPGPFKRRLNLILCKWHVY